MPQHALVCVCVCASYMPAADSESNAVNSGLQNTDKRWEAMKINKSTKKQND